MHRCPACDQPNHGTEKCIPLWDEYGKRIVLRHEEQKKQAVVEQRKFIGSGEDVALLD